MTETLIARAEQHDYQKLFLQDLNWSSPDHPPVTYSADGHTLTATNVSSYKGLRVWVVNQKPDSKLEAALDQVIAKTSTDRLVIFHDGTEQVWRWPVRRATGNSTATRLSRHRHRTGDQDPRFAAKLEAIRLPLDASLDPNAVLAKVRAAFDVEAQNETKHASKLMARLYAAMEKAYPDGHDRKARDHQISVSLARILFLMFADDTDMWRQDLFRDFIHEHTAPDGSDIGAQLSALFDYLDTPPAERHSAAGEFDGFRHVNGGIFRERINLPVINAEFRSVVLEACDRDWAAISPAIFGSMFQSVRDAKTRRELGEHYTSEENILKTLNPLFLDELRAEFEHIKTLGKHEADRLRKLRDKLGRIRYMDPACGCGNFIIVAYRELRDLELAIMERLQEITGDGAMLLANVGLKVTLDHFYGIEIDEWPARIAETAMFLIDRQCDLKLTERLGWAPDRLPIQKQATIVVCNALWLDWATVVDPSDDLVIAGNPPFLGHKERTPEQAADLKLVWDGSTVGHLDYVTGWYAKAVAFLGVHSARWAFVSTNSVAQGEGVPTLFSRIFRAGWRIRFAHRTFQWSSESSNPAGVQCVIVGFDRDAGPALLYDYKDPKGPALQREVSFVNAYLVDAANVLVAPSRKPLADLPTIRAGSTPIDWDNLAIKQDDDESLVLLRADPIAAKYLRRYVGGKELIHDIERWCLWLAPDSHELRADIARSPELKRRVELVRQKRLESAREATKKLAAKPFAFGEIRQPTHDYLGIPQTFSEHRPFATAARRPAAMIASVKLFTAEDRDGFLFSLISSSMFLTWQLTVGGKLESRPSFSSSVVWNTFPLPRLTYSDRDAIVKAGRAVEDVRLRYPGSNLGELYRAGSIPDDLMDAHRVLDHLIDAAFGSVGGVPTFSDRQRLLFERYQELAAPLLHPQSRGVTTRRRRGVGGGT